jgi:ribulose-phosphate 3-epimerase
LKKSKRLKKTEIGLAVQIQHKCQKDIMLVLNEFPFKFVQFMGIEKIGYGGQNLTSKVFRKMKKLRKLREKMPISVDGGVKHFNAEKLKNAGATRLVAGSGFFGGEDLKKRKKEFEIV